MRRRSYAGGSDVARLQRFNAESIAATGGCGYLHPGDIVHHLFFGNKLFDPADLTTIWEDGSGVAAWVLAHPTFKAYDIQIRHDLRGGTFEREVLEYADVRIGEVMKANGVESDSIVGDAFRCDLARIELMAEAGWKRDEDPPYIINRARIADVPEPEIPTGYTIRPVAGVEEVAAVTAVHQAAFPGAAWTEEQYRHVMESPGYDPARELVAVAPDGTFAAFAVTWYDELNRTGLMEGVGTHVDHRRIGLGRAIVRFAAHHMATVGGMEYATVANSESNTASSALYRSAGFEPWHVIDGYIKPIE